jgi:steroid 5-alpha reductase family enzyme
MENKMKHLINLAIAAGVFIFTKTYAELISFNSIQISGINLLEQTLIIAFAIQWVAFVPAFILKTEKFYDLTGSLTYLSIFIYCLVATDSIGNLKFSNILVAGSVMIWAMRLGSFLFMRISKDGKDERFNSIKTSFSRFFMTWTLQGMWVFICSSAALVAITSPTGVIISNIFIIGFVLFIFGFVIEVIADNQKSRFRSKKENKNSFINEGLWARSRHPNYFGEITLWTGITVMALPTFIGMNYLALFSPIFTYLLLNHVSGIRLLEARGHQKWGHLDAYNKYKKDTPKLIPMIIGKK